MARLTPRELDCIKALAAHPNESYAMLARRVGMRPSTYKDYMQRVRLRLQARTNLECVLICLEQGILRLEECLWEW